MRDQSARASSEASIARRVSAELTRHGIVADDSAGEPVATTPTGSFLRLLFSANLRDRFPQGANRFRIAIESFADDGRHA